MSYVSFDRKKGKEKQKLIIDKKKYGHWGQIQQLYKRLVSHVMFIHVGRDWKMTICYSDDIVHEMSTPMTNLWSTLTPFNVVILSGTRARFSFLNNRRWLKNIDLSRMTLMIHNNIFNHFAKQLSLIFTQISCKKWMG